jgi:hypothetical protein
LSKLEEHDIYICVYIYIYIYIYIFIECVMDRYGTMADEMTCPPVAQGGEAGSPGSEAGSRGPRSAEPPPRAKA